MTKAVLLAISCGVLYALPQPRPAVLRGHVVRVGTTTPVAHARIVAGSVGGSADGYLTMTTDEAGRFAFQGVTAGTYRIYATRDGYLQGEYGRRAAGASGISVVLTEGQTSPDILISMTPAGAIAGRVLDGGRPVANAWVRALQARYLNGERNLDLADWAQTDDRGQYRLFGLAPGLYFVSAIPRQQPRIEGDALVTPGVPSNANGNQSSVRSPLALDTLPVAAFDRGVYPMVYHPGTTDPAAAQPVDVRGGETAIGVDFTIVTTPAFHVRGRVVVAGAGAAAPARIGIRAIGGTGTPIPGVQDNAGVFDVPGVPPGRYLLSAQVTAQGTPGIFAALPIEVADRDLDEVAITMLPGVSVTGRLSIDAQPAPADPPLSVQLMGIPVLPCCSAVRIQPDGAFTVPNVPPGDYRLRVIQAGRTPWVKSAQFGETDVVNAPIHVESDLQGRQLEIVVGSRTATLDALVVDAAERPLSGVLVIAVPDAARRNQSQAYRTATTDADGRARIERLAPGEYTLFASDSIEAGAWQDPDVLRRHASRGSIARFAEGATQTITLRIVP